MIKQDPQELNKMKEVLGQIDKSVDPTVGAGMNMDDVVNKLLEEAHQKGDITEEDNDDAQDR